MTSFASLGQALRTLRHLRGLTASALAERAGITKGMLSQYERGKVLPKLPTLSRILQALDADLVDLHVAMTAAQEERPLVLPVPDARSGGQLSLRPEVRLALADALEGFGRLAETVARDLRSDAEPQDLSPILPG